MLDDDMFWIALIAYVALAPGIALLLSIIVFRRQSRLKREVASLLGKLALVSGEVPVSPTADSDPAHEAKAPAAQTDIARRTTAEDPASGEEEPPERPTEEVREPSRPETGVEAQKETESRPPKRPFKDRPAIGWEQRLASKWMLWLGGLALALGGGFLVKVSIEIGLLGPALRCSLGALLGLALTLGGEVLRRQPLQIKLAEIAPNHLPPALSAAGIAILFASIYAAYGLYDLIPALVAFLALGVVAFSAVGLALLQGPFIAALGLLGGFLTPVIVSTGRPDALALFSFLTALTLASLCVARYRNRWWLALMAMAGANGWAALWAGAMWQTSSAPIFAFYILILALATVWYRHDLFSLPKDSASKEAETIGWRNLDLLVTLSIAGIFFNAFFFVRLDHYGFWSIGSLALLSAFALFQGRRTSALFLLPAVASASVLLVLASWHLPQFIEGASPYIVLQTGPAEQSTVADPRVPIIPPELFSFAGVSFLFALIFGLGGYAARHGAEKTARFKIFR
ncbi:MAG: DUF2339 domain-containing protein, partial [Kiloniellales bacterium]|nr:DUF2339 domain-containing protein [Kiloniellales bacterium]